MILVPDWIFIRYASHLSFPLNSNSYPQMKHKFYNDGNWSRSVGVVRARLVHNTFSFEEGLLLHAPSSHEEGHCYTSSHEEGQYYTTSQQPTAHLTPVPFIQKHALNIFTMYRTAISRPVNKCIYKYIHFVYTGPMKREGNRNYRNGDLTKDVSTWSSTYIKTLD